MVIPALQIKQEVEPGLFWKDPAGHGIADDAPALQ